jgi:hypothetical protein
MLQEASGTVKSRDLGIRLHIFESHLSLPDVYLFVFT